MIVNIDLSEDVLDKLGELAKKEGRSRKKHIEVILENFVDKKRYVVTESTQGGAFIRAPTQNQPKTNYAVNIPPTLKTPEEWILEKRELEDPDLYKKWFSELEAAPNLTIKQKSLIKQA